MSSDLELELESSSSTNERPVVVVPPPTESASIEPRREVRHYHIIRTVTPGFQRLESRPARRNNNAHLHRYEDRRLHSALGSGSSRYARHVTVPVVPARRVIVDAGPSHSSVKKSYYNQRNDIVRKMYNVFDRAESLLDRACDLCKGIESIVTLRDSERIKEAGLLAETCVPLCKEIVEHIDFLGVEVTQRTLGRYDRFKDALQSVFRTTDTLLARKTL